MLRMTFFSGTWRAMKLPRLASGMKKMLRCGSSRTTLSAFDEVTQTSAQVFTSAVVLT